MSRTFRNLLFFISSIPLALLMIPGLGGLPPYGIYTGPYGDVINRSFVPQRHVTNGPTAIIFDYRGLDTLGEEFILFVSAAAIALLLRKKWGEVEDESAVDSASEPMAGPSEAVRWMTLWMTGLTAFFGCYVVLHGQLTPGGGFQGGVIVGTAFLVMFLGNGKEAFDAITPKTGLDVTEALGAGAYALIGLAVMLAGAAFLQNTLPLGKQGDLLSGGTIFLINVAVGIEVSAAFGLIVFEFIQETQRVRKDEKP